jgi:radical SAM superfamily enzyme YgiQ (UPF0313 family)
VSILDAFAERLSIARFKERVALDQYDVAAFTGMSPVIDTVNAAVSASRKHARFTVLGGPHATVFKEKLLENNPDLDYVVFGEGEETFIELLGALEAGTSPATIAGVATREGSGPQRAFCSDLNDIPFPARDLLPMNKYRHPLSAGRVTTMITSRGCPYPCIFCDKGVFGSNWRARSAENVLSEIDEVVNRFKVNSIIFYDDLFTLKHDRLEAICEGIIRKNYRISWKAEGRVDIVDPDTLRLMKRAGCDTVAYGVETANQAGLDYLRKKTTPAQIRSAFEMTRNAGLKTMGYFILGIPVETYKDAVRTIDFAVEIKTDFAQFSVLSPLPGTRLHDDAMDKGWYRRIAAQNVSDKDLLRPVVISDNWSEDSLISIVREAHRRFYMRPSYMIKSLFAVRSPADLFRLTGMGMDMVKYVMHGKQN